MTNNSCHVAVAQATYIHLFISVAPQPHLGPGHLFVEGSRSHTHTHTHTHTSRFTFGFLMYCLLLFNLLSALLTK